MFSFKKIKAYTELSPQAEVARAALLRENTYNKGDYFIAEGQTPKRVAFKAFIGYSRG